MLHIKAKEVNSWKTFKRVYCNKDQKKHLGGGTLEDLHAPNSAWVQGSGPKDLNLRLSSRENPRPLIMKPSPIILTFP